MRINTNTAAMNTYSNLTSANASKSGSLAKLSSGLRINKAGDDAAGLAISEKMKNQISGMTQASRNAQDGISLIQTAEGGLTETHSILNRMRDLTVQASNDTNTTDDRKAIQKEIDSLTEEVDRIAKDTEFNTKSLLTEKDADGKATANGTTFKFQIGANSKQNISVTIGNMTASGLGITGPGKETETPVVDPEETETPVVDPEETETPVVDPEETETSVVDPEETETPAAPAPAANTSSKVDVSAKGANFDDILSTIDGAIAKVSTERANLGAVQNRLDHTVSNLATTKENLSEANSRITDVDMAEEMMSFTKSNILSQASTSMLAQANQMPQSVLSLLQ